MFGDLGINLVYSIGVIFLVVFAMSCGSRDVQLDKLLEDQQKEIQLASDREKKLLSRVDEFATMTAPTKHKRPYFVKSAVVLVKMPGQEFELQGWEKDDAGEMKKCLFDKCHGHDVLWLKDYLPKDGIVNSVVRAVCKPKKKLGALEIGPTIVVGDAFSTVCSITVIDLDSQSIVESREVTFDKFETDPNGKIFNESIVKSADKKSSYVAPYNGIGKFLNDLSKSNLKLSFCREAMVAKCGD